MADDAPQTLDSAMDTTMGAIWDEANAPAKAEGGDTLAKTQDAVTTEIAKDTTSGPVRGPDGKFTKAAPDAAAPKEITDQAQAAAAETQEPASIDPPQSWSAEAKALWATLSPDAQKVIAQREGEAHKQITQQGERLKGYENLQRVLEPRRAVLVSRFGSEAAGIDWLLNMADLADKDWRGFVQEQSRLRGFDLSQLSPAQQSQLPADPTLAAIVQKLGSLESNMAQREQAAYQQRVDTLQAEIDDFAKDKPHFKTLEPLMMQLCQSGVAKGYRDAWDMACKLDPTVSAALAAEKAAADKAKADAEAKRIADEARRHVAVNQTSKGNGASPSKPASHDEIMGGVWDRLNAH